MIGYSIGVSHDRGLFKSVYLMSFLENNVTFIYYFQGHLEETIQVKFCFMAGKAKLGFQV